MADDRTGTDRRQELDMVREVATHASDIRHIQEDVSTMAKNMEAMQITLTAIDKTLSEAKGGWKMLMIIGGVSGTVGAGLVQVAHWWNK
jgi:hypothetical protein